MFSRIMRLAVVLSLLSGSNLLLCAAAQDPAPAPAAPQAAPDASATRVGTKSSAQSQTIVLPAGTKLPLVLRNGINTRTAKAGDSVYFETIYPIAQNNQILIPMGSFARGHLLEAKRPGRIKGRGEFRMLIESVTLPNGSTFSLVATPNSMDTHGREGVDKEGKIIGPSSVGRDAATVLLATAVGGPVGTYSGALAGSSLSRSTAIGHGAGAAIGIAVILLTRGREAELTLGMTMDVVLDHDVSLDPALASFANLGRDLAPPPAPANPQDGIPERPRSRLERRRLPFPFTRFLGGFPF